MKRVRLVLIPLLFTVGCRIHDVRTVVIQAPGVRCAQCAERVARALSALEGVKTETVAFDLERGTVTVTFDSMLVAIKNLEHAVADAGYSVAAKPYPLPAREPAHSALPAECREHFH